MTGKVAVSRVRISTEDFMKVQLKGAILAASIREGNHVAYSWCRCVTFTIRWPCSLHGRDGNSVRPVYPGNQQGSARGPGPPAWAITYLNDFRIRNAKLSPPVSVKYESQRRIDPSPTRWHCPDAGSAHSGITRGEQYCFNFQSPPDDRGKKVRA